MGQQHELVLLDVMLQPGDGRKVLRRIRAVSQVPIIMLTARGDEADRITGLEGGADDYLPKPFHPRELIARIHALTQTALCTGTRQGVGDRRPEIHPSSRQVLRSGTLEKSSPSN